MARFDKQSFNQLLHTHAQYIYMDRAKRIWYLSPMRAAKVQASLHIRAVLPEPLLLAHTSSESRGTFRQKARSLAPLNGWTCTVKICHDGMLEDTNSLDGAHIVYAKYQKAVKALVQVDFPVYAVSKHKQNSYLKANRKKMAKFTKLSFCQKRFFRHQTSLCKCSMSLYCVDKVSNCFSKSCGTS